MAEWFIGRLRLVLNRNDRSVPFYQPVACQLRGRTALLFGRAACSCDAEPGPLGNGGERLSRNGSSEGKGMPCVRTSGGSWRPDTEGARFIARSWLISAYAPVSRFLASAFL